MKRVSLLLISAAATLLVASSAQAARTTISGKLRGATGVTVIAVAANGTAVRQRLRADGRFRLSLPSAKDTTLQLVSRDGRYLGPVVLRHSGKRAYTTLRGPSAALGALKLRAGYAVAVRPLAAALVNTRKAVTADKRGKPIGAGRLGLVRTKRVATAGFLPFGFLAEPNSQPGADTDSDGVPNSVDADDNGNLVLDNVDPTTPAGTSGLFSTLYLPFGDTLNADAAGVTTEQIDAVFSGADRFNLIFFFSDGQFRGRTITGAHVDCFALVYCRKGDGTAIMGGLSESSPSLPRGTPWVDYSPDGSGYPNLEQMTSHDNHSVWAAGVQPRVGTGAIRPGDTYDVVFKSAQGDISVPTTLAPYFVTTPALASWSSNLASGTVSYPVAPGAPGTGGNPIQLDSGSMTLTFWRPQRAGIAGADRTSYVDMGHLRYGVMPSPAGVQVNSEVGCAGHYSAVSPELAPAQSNDSFADSFWPYRDSGDDAAPNAARTLSFRVDLAGCLTAAGVNPMGLQVNLSLTATSEPRAGGADRASQSLAVQLP